MINIGKRRLILGPAMLLVLCVVVALGIWQWKRRSAARARYQTATVERGELTQVVSATGQLNPVVNVQVGSQISGTISKLFADFNSEVKAGQVVAQIDPATYRAAVMQAEGELASARAALELAQINARRARELFEGKLIPQSDYDKAMADLHQAEATVRIREGALEKARVDLARCTIYSPIDGIVISRNVDVGQTVAASLQAPTLFVIANDLSKMQINASVAEADIGSVEVGQPVTFTVDAFPDRSFHGRVSQVRNAPVVVQNVVTYDTIIEVDNPQLKLRPGMTANVSIIIAHRSDALKLPNAALRFRPPEPAQRKPGEAHSGSAGRRAAEARGGPRRDRGAQRTVYVLGAAGKPEPRQIKTGISDGVYTEVLEGLSEGERVITAMLVADTGAAPPPGPFGPVPRGMRRF